MKECEEALPRLKDGDLEHASRLYKAKTGVGDITPKIVQRRNGACRLWRISNNRHHPLARQARQTLSGFFVNAFEEEAELNSLEPKTVGVLVTGMDSGADPGNGGRKGARLEHASRARSDETRKR